MLDWISVVCSVVNTMKWLPQRQNTQTFCQVVDGIQTAQGSAVKTDSIIQM